jgi:hypothetical protein
MWDFGQCDARRCTGKKLERFGWIKGLKPSQRCRGNAIVLTPDGKQSVVGVSFVALTYETCFIRCTTLLKIKSTRSARTTATLSSLTASALSTVRGTRWTHPHFSFLLVPPDILQYLFLSVHFFIDALYFFQYTSSLMLCVHILPTNLTYFRLFFEQGG